MLAGQFLGQLGVQVAVVLFATRYAFGLVALERVNVEYGAEAAAVGPGNAVDANVELATICWVGVPGVVARLVHLSGVGAHEAVAHLGLLAAFDQVGPNADTLLRVVGEAGRALVLGGLAVPARVKDAAIGGVREEAVEARAVGRRDGRFCWAASKRRAAGGNRARL